jgi:hypothetical protein
VDLSELDRAAAGDHPGRRNVLAEGGQSQLLGDLRLAHERPGAVAALEVAVRDEVVERGADR